MAKEKLSWDDAIDTGSYVRINTEEEKCVTLTDWRFEKQEATFKNKTGPEASKQVIAFVAECVEEDGRELKEPKLFETASNRLKIKLRPIFEGKEPTEKIKIRILRTGTKYDTQYSVKQV